MSISIRDVFKQFVGDQDEFLAGLQKPIDDPLGFGASDYYDNDVSKRDQMKTCKRCGLEFRVVVEFLTLPTQYLVPSREYPGRNAILLGHCPGCGGTDLELVEDDGDEDL